jgi:hypothetical protein
MSDDRVNPATKGDLLDLRSEFKSDLQSLRDELIEVIRDSQTETLRTFYGFTQTIQTRFQDQDLTEASLKRRMTVIEERLLAVEKRLNMPPAA